MFAASKTAGAVSAEVNYIEDVFSTWLYQGNGSTQTITNGIDLSGKGGLVWLKDRSGASINQHTWVDTNRGVNNWINSASTFEQSPSNILSSYNTTGFTLSDSVRSNQSGASYVGWTFRKQPKFFDVVTWTGDGVAGRQISHSLGSAPGAIIVKCTSVARDWAVWQNTLSDGTYLKLNTTDSVITNTSFQVFGNASGQTSTYFTVGQSGSGVNGLTNANGDTYVAYLFADDAGGFGLTGTDNVISCGSTDGVSTVNLGYEPQWVLIKKTNDTSNWTIIDTMRGWPVSPNGQNWLYPNLANAEGVNFSNYGGLNSTGFSLNFTSGDTYIYIAIRRGPMKVPTSGTSVFAPLAFNSSAGTVNTTGFPVDSQWNGLRSGDGQNANVNDRLRGISSTSTSTGVTLATSSTAAERTDVTSSQGWSNTGFQTPSFLNATSTASWNFRRAPGFFDEVCYTGTGSNITLNHNLGVAPELMIVKVRAGSANDWAVYSSTVGASQYFTLNGTFAPFTLSSIWNSTAPTSSVFTVGTNSATNGVNQTYVAYLFATCPGVSKVGSYTGNGTTQTINCGFTGGARFVLIRRTDSTGDWYVYDTARGMTTLTDPYLLLNSTTAESATLGSVTTVSTGFAVNASILAAINTNAASYIFLAIA